ncbi:20976_t:CDS:10 [Dentiscutata erythropus]|uniref:20976_t:CDS:1 n=1 Tax=Dentiscutata erythropus TaxID=1348616 RepID=A0A9N9ANQ5_9GLOM|nr:20976_t:CDS:10 [Dentiscutata erythropus]
MVPENNINDNAENSINNDAKRKIHDEEKIYDEEKIHDEENNLEKKLEDNSDNELISAASYQTLFVTSLILVYSVFFVILVSYIMGKWLEKILPNKKFRIKNWEFNLNPGPFNYKEHVCIAAAANAGGVSAYAVFVPEYMFPWLSGAAILCLIAPNNNTVKTLGSVYRGAGILGVSLDWNAIGQVDPLFTPCNMGHWSVATRIMDPVTGVLDVTSYENYSPVYMSAVFAACYCYSFMQVTATICHVILFHGKEIWNRYKKTREEEEETDIHCKMMSIYPEVPYYWYIAIFFVMLIIAIILGYKVNLPWWGVLLAIALAIFMVLPIGIIQAVSNWQLGLNVLTELVCGFGYPIANVYFKAYGHISLTQCLLFVQDLKLGHYMKIPPRSMFISQIWGTFVGIIVNYWTTNIVINTKRSYIDGTEVDPTGQWAGLQPEIFNTASIIWRLIGPGRVFGSSSIYNVLLWGFLIGGFLPIPFYLLHQKFPKAKFNLVNFPIIFYGLSVFPQTYPNFIITGFIAGFLSQFYAFRYKHMWWKKYNYVMSAAFDSGAQIMTMVAFICINGIVKVQFPTWWGNDPSTQSEHCFPIKS